MDTISASSSYSPSVSPFPMPEDASTAVRFPAEFGMVKIELEAAEALADLAGLTESETCGDDSASHRVDDESPTEESVLIISNLDQDQETSIHLQCARTCNFLSEKVKNEKHVKLKQNRRCITTNNRSSTSSSCKSRQKLTEAEKESRKVRRVLANRESARQTIRRRQAFHEELTKKAADLALENEKLKREKEFAMKEYDSSKSRNDLLKARMNELVESEEIRREESNLNNVEVPISSASTTCPVFIYSQPFNSTFLWPSIVQPSNSVEAQAQMLPTGNPDSYYVLPFPFLFPLPHNDNVSRTQSLNPYNKQQQDSLTIQQFSCTREENCGLDLSMKVQTEVSDSMDPNYSPAQTVKRENRQQQENSGGVKAHLPMAGDRRGLPEKCPASGLPARCRLAFWRRRKADAVAATEARRKRKEVTRLKNHHLRLSS